MRSVFIRNAFALCLLGLAFLLQFQLAKHWAPWSAVSPFSEDPWDAVGSFAAQFVLFMMIVSFVRALRRAPDDPARSDSFTRGALMTAAAIAFTCLSDLLAMVRHISLWNSRPQGVQLFAVTTVLLLWSAAVGAWFLLPIRAEIVPYRPNGRRLVIPAVALLLLAVYPEHVRNSVAGAIFTALCGSLMLFIAVWAVGTALLPASEIGAKRANRHRAGQWRWGWGLAIVTGLACGALLVAQELARPGPSPQGSRRVLVILVYLFLETAGVVTGYWLLADPLALVPRD